MTRDYSILQSIKISVLFIAALWGVLVLDSVFTLHLGHLGVYPRVEIGLIGIVMAPLIHGHAEHLAANSLGLLVLGSALIYGYPKSRWPVIIIIWLASGFGVWLFGRSSFHFGASGLTHGLFFYLFFISLLRRDRRSIALMMIAFFMFGGMLMSIFPRDPEISFEYHLFGGLAGLGCALAFRHWDPLPEAKSYSWEKETDSNEHDAIGDLWQQSPEDAATRQGKPGEPGQKP
ncbi:Membrane associated serine protease, rhomboid family [Ferrimonas sediminum]|uniref:Membrane associated serine protease, rhomboid family n=1 Tax=Ferrimonas sediminum TaxID=718193 RepID=A0A1G8VFK8_9GAMM|nr:rhomboid family intramembrane serine protease [Ferrimonas sediminum]SDJ64105.1 Membrane associated serine protease, rhomboid family [Ferrimonas sediminum]